MHMIFDEGDKVKFNEEAFLELRDGDYYNEHAWGQVRKMTEENVGEIINTIIEDADYWFDVKFDDVVVEKVPLCHLEIVEESKGEGK